jgi:hypothetical protein
MVENLYNYDWTDLYFIEHYYGKLGCHVQSTENIFISDVDVFFNNRKICDLLMSLPLSDRKKDKIYKDLPVFLGMDRQNSEIVVKNPSQHTFFRMLFDKWWFKFTVNRFI